MDVDEVKARRVKLTTEIGELVNTFQKETGLTVKAVDLRHLLTVTSETPVKTQVEIRLELP